MNGPENILAPRLTVGDRIPIILTPAELRVQLNYSRTRFFELEKAGAFDALRVDGLGGTRRYSGLKLQRILSTEAAPPTRYFDRARRQR